MAESNMLKDAYKMSSDPSGYCVIINIINFDGNSEDERNTSIESVNLMRKAFEYLNFKAIIWTDLKDFEIKSKLNEILNSEECDSHDCFVLYIHSHGKEGFITANNNVIEYHEICEMFSNANCKKFIDKPKLIFFDCCRGKFSSAQFMEPDNKRGTMALYSDLYAVYSTHRKLISIRGWFAQSWSYAIMQFAHEMHFGEILVEVNKAIKKKYHYLTGHRQSIESNPIAQNKHKLFFKRNCFKLDELKQDNFLNKIVSNDMELEHSKQSKSQKDNQHEKEINILKNRIHLLELKKKTNSGDNITSKLIDGNIVVRGNLNISDAKVVGKSS